MRREIHSNYRLGVTLSLREMGLLRDHGAVLNVLHEMTSDIRRHVDHVAGVTITFDTRAVCSYCGNEWEEVTADDLASHPDDYKDHILGEPMCCTRAAEEFRHNRTDNKENQCRTP
ncbi:hypothetical protein [Nonomuraea wenchangensis]|uniref:hypothetical protein n=1 Tax=Nonomuraea wenchangensis TaxID=568860 RepID=UPI00332EF605